MDLEDLKANGEDSAAAAAAPANGALETSYDGLEKADAFAQHQPVAVAAA